MQEVSRLQKELELEKQKNGASGDQYNILMMQFNEAKKEKDDTQRGLAEQLKREKLAHQETLVHQKEIEAELDAEHKARVERDAEIENVKAQLKNALEMSEQEKNALVAKKDELMNESNEKSTKISELQTLLAKNAAAKQAALEALHSEAAVATAALRSEIVAERSAKDQDHAKMLALQAKLSDQLENERAARNALEVETEQVRQDRDAKEKERQELLARLRQAEAGGEEHLSLEAELQRQLDEEHQLAEKLRAERDQQLSQIEQDNARRQELSANLSAEEQRRQETEDKLAALQNVHAKTEEEEAKLRELEKHLVIDLNLARDEIKNLQAKLQDELDAERKRSKDIEISYKQEMESAEKKHKIELEELKHSMEEKDELTAKLVARKDEELALAAMERAKLAQEHEQQQLLMSKQLEEHLDENRALTAKAADDLEKLRQETDKTTSKYKAEEARLLADLAAMKTAESALRDSYKKQLENEQKMHNKTKEEREKLNKTLSDELVKEKQLKEDLSAHMKNERNLEEEIAALRADLSANSDEKNKRLQELEDAKRQHDQEKLDLEAAVLAATNDREAIEKRLLAEIKAQKDANEAIQLQARSKQTVLDRMIDSERKRAAKHKKEMVELHKLQISDEKKAKNLARARKNLDKTNQALHDLESKLLKEIAKERAAANKINPETKQIKQERDELEKNRRILAGKLDDASRRNKNLSQRQDDLVAEKERLQSGLQHEQDEQKQNAKNLSEHAEDTAELERQLAVLSKKEQTEEIAQRCQNLVDELNGRKKEHNSLKKKLSKSNADMRRIQAEVEEKLADIKKETKSLIDEKKSTEKELEDLQAEHAQMLIVIVRYQADAQAAIAKKEYNRAEVETAHAKLLEERIAELEENIKYHDENEKKNKFRS